MFARAVQILALWSMASPGMDHRQHIAVEGFPDCTACHAGKARADEIRPGTDSHATCDGAGCHAEDFLPAGYKKTEICTTCHVRKSKIGAPLVPFPPPEAELEFYAEINHQTHMRPKAQERMEDRCLHCHRIDRATKTVARPGHTVCKECHDADASVKMTDCAKCHTFRRDEKGTAVPIGPRGRKNPCRVKEKFSHETHRLDARQSEPTEVSCGTCHFGLARAKTLAAIVPTHGRRTMNACGRCHKRGQKTFAGQALLTTTGDCTGCHGGACLTVGAIVPSWHR